MLLEEISFLLSLQPIIHSLLPIVRCSSLSLLPIVVLYLLFTLSLPPAAFSPTLSFLLARNLIK